MNKQTFVWNNDSNRVIKPQFAGSWYPADPASLVAMIDADLNATDIEPQNDVFALIVPHAGYPFSGSIAARAVGTLRDPQRFKRVIVLAPSHRTPLSRRLAMPDAAAMETPLGRFPIDRRALQQLGTSDFFVQDSAAFDGEHSIEIQLPILQRALGDVSLVPLLVGRMEDGDAAAMARDFLSIVDEHTLIVVSSDFTHYGHSFGYRPFDEPVADNIRSLDEGAFREIARLDREGFLNYCRRTGATICGRDPIALLLDVLPDNAKALQVAYTTSGHLTGDFSHCVSYLAAVFMLPSGWTRQGHRDPDIEPAFSSRRELPAADRRELLRLARTSIEFRFRHGRAPSMTELPCSPTPAMMAKRGVFVTLYGPGHRLRGCIGEIQPRYPLFEAVTNTAVLSAFHDPRFPPLQAEEWPGITLEISALTPPRPVDTIAAIEIGRHGIILKKEGNVAVFLPQVATEQQWDLEQTLSHLSQKAGLPADAWKQGAGYHVFEAEVFRE